MAIMLCRRGHEGKDAHLSRLGVFKSHLLLQQVIHICSKLAARFGGGECCDFRVVMSVADMAPVIKNVGFFSAALCVMLLDDEDAAVGPRGNAIGHQRSGETQKYALAFGGIDTSTVAGAELMPKTRWAPLFQAH